MDKMLVYMYLMHFKSRDCGINISRTSLISMGENVEFYPGVVEWFDLVEGLANDIGVEVEHYIISSGLKEMIEGTLIYPNFKEVFACEYLYDVNGNIVWPKNVVNYTTKTQFIFRINKGTLDLSDDSEINKFQSYRSRRIPFEHMIYFGDGDTDIPCMKLVYEKGGHSIAVYADETMKDKAKDLYRDHRVTFFAPANYEKDGEIYQIVSDIMNCIVYGDRLYHRSEGYGIERKDISK